MEPITVDEIIINFVQENRSLYTIKVAKIYDCLVATLLQNGLSYLHLTCNIRRTVNDITTYCEIGPTGAEGDANFVTASFKCLDEVTHATCLKKGKKKQKKKKDQHCHCLIE